MRPPALLAGGVALALAVSLAIAGLIVALANRRPAPPCARFTLSPARWQSAPLFASGTQPTVREQIAAMLIDCGTLIAMPISDLSARLGQPPPGRLGHPGGESWSYPLALTSLAPPRARSLLVVSFEGLLVHDAAIVRPSRHPGRRASAAGSSSSMLA